jgi:hypothetical protein
MKPITKGVVQSLCRGAGEELIVNGEFNGLAGWTTGAAYNTTQDNGNNAKVDRNGGAYAAMCSSTTWSETVGREYIIAITCLSEPDPAGTATLRCVCGAWNTNAAPEYGGGDIMLPGRYVFRHTGTANVSRDFDIFAGNWGTAVVEVTSISITTMN